MLSRRELQKAIKNGGRIFDDDHNLLGNITTSEMVKSYLENWTNAMHLMQEREARRPTEILALKNLDGQRCAVVKLADGQVCEMTAELLEAEPKLLASYLVEKPTD